MAMEVFTVVVAVAIAIVVVIVVIVVSSCTEVRIQSIKKDIVIVGLDVIFKTITQRCQRHR
jgi:hypothetical protein